MEIIYTIGNSELYNDFLEDNYTSISITEDVIYRNNKRYINRNITLKKIKEKEYDKTYNINKKELIFKIIERFINENLSYVGISNVNDRLQITLITKDNKTINITTPLIKEYKELVEKIKNINIVDDSYYDMIDNEQIKKIRIVSIKSEDNIKSLMYQKNSEELKIIITSNNFDNMEEIKELINYYKNKYKLKEIDVINIENSKKKKVYTNDDNEIDIVGKEFIKYIEGNDKNDNNGKTSKHM